MNPGCLFIFCSCSALRIALLRFPAHSVAPDEVVRRAVVGERRLRLALELRNDALGQHLAELDPPLVERVDVPNDARSEYAVLVECDQLSEGLGREPLGQDRVGGSIAVKHPMWDFLPVVHLVNHCGLHHDTGHGFTCQMSAAYSAIVRSLENFPELATFRMALRVQASGSVYSARRLLSASR